MALPGEVDGRGGGSRRNFVQRLSVYERTPQITPRQADGKRRHMAYLGWLPSARVGTFCRFAAL